MRDDELLEAIRRAQAEDAPRLAYAEVLSRRGDPRGEFITLACDNAQRRARGELGDVYVAQTQREWAILREHRAAFLSAMGLVTERHTHYTWARGFVSEVATMPGPVLEMAPALQRLPLELLQVSYPERTDVAKLLAAGVLGSAPALMIDQVSRVPDPLDAEDIQALVEGLPKAGVESLSLCFHHFPGAIPRVAGVRSLRLGDDLDGLALLSALGTFSSALRELTLTTDRAPLDVYRRLLSDPSLSALEALTILSFRADEGDVMAGAVASAKLPSLTSLYVMDLSEASVDALSTAPSVAGLRSLKLSSACLNGARLRRLLEHAPLIEELSLGVEIDQGAVEVIARFASPSLRRLVLDTGSSSLDLRPLVTTSRYALRELECRADGVNDDFFAALADSPFASHLASFTYAGPVTARGARALAASRDLASGLAIVQRMTNVEDAMTVIQRRFPLAYQTL